MMEVINKKDFIKVVLNKKIKAFVIYLSYLSVKSMIIYSTREIALLLIKKTTMLAEYADDTYIFLHELIQVLP